MKKIAIGNDHAAVEMKFKIVEYLNELGYEVINVGTDSEDSFDYPVASFNVCKLINEKKAELGILICGTGVGISIAANKIDGIRAACVSEALSSKLSREHNNANVICFGARVVGLEVAKDIVKNFLETDFLGGRHEKRVSQITELENKGSIDGIK